MAPTRPESVAADWSLAEFMDGVAHLHHFTAYPVVAENQVVGLLAFASVARVPRGDWETIRVADCMLPIVEATTVQEDEPLLEAIGDMQEGRLDRALVLVGDQVVGLPSLTDVGRFVAQDQR